MKKQNVSKKLELNKETIAQLNTNQMSVVKGKGLTQNCPFTYNCNLLPDTYTGISCRSVLFC